MGETCLHVPARVFGFNESNSEITMQQRGPGSAQLEQRASLLSALLKGESSSRPPMQSTYMETSDTETEDERDTEMEEQEEDEEEEDEEGNCGGWRAEANAGSAPVPIPSTSEAFLKAQREALKRFVYVHQIDEMRRQCAAYFARQARFEGRAADNTGNTLPPASTAPVGADVSTTTRGRLQQTPSQRRPGF